MRKETRGSKKTRRKADGQNTIFDLLELFEKDKEQDFNLQIYIYKNESDKIGKNFPWFSKKPPTDILCSN